MNNLSETLDQITENLSRRMNLVNAQPGPKDTAAQGFFLRDLKELDAAIDNANCRLKQNIEHEEVQRRLVAEISKPVIRLFSRATGSLPPTP